MPVSLHFLNGFSCAVVFLISTPLCATDGNDSRFFEEVQRQEKFYENLELTIEHRFVQSNPINKPPDGNPQAAGFGFMSSKMDKQVSIVVVGNRFRVNSTVNTSHSDNADTTTKGVEVYDGDTHQSYSESNFNSVLNRNAYVSKKIGTLTNLARPHMMLMESGCPLVPLSVYLHGQDAISTFPGIDESESEHTEVQDKGVGTVQGLKCRRILIDNVLENGTRHNGWELWLAEDRNLIPARLLSYMYRESMTEPVAVSTVFEWKELRTGVWFPMKIHQERYRFIADQPRVRAWTGDYEVTSVSLEPRPTPATFGKLEFPAGTKVVVRP